MIKKYVVLILATVVLQGLVFPLERRLYRVSSRRQWRLDRKSNAEMEAFRRSLPKGDKIIQDSINDQLMVVTPVEIDIEELLKSINAG